MLVLFLFCYFFFCCCCCWKTRLRFASRASPERPGAAPAARAAPPRLTACQPGGAARLGVARLGSARLGRSPPIMQSYKYDKAIPPESKNGGSPALNNNPAKSSSKKALLICLDFLCLVMGEQPRELRGAPRPFPPLLSPPTSPQPPPQPPGLLLWESLAEGGRAELGRAPAVPLPKQKRSGAGRGAGPPAEPSGERGSGGGTGRAGERVPPGSQWGWARGENGAAAGQPAPRAKWWAQHPSHLDLLLFIFCFSPPPPRPDPALGERRVGGWLGCRRGAGGTVSSGMRPRRAPPPPGRAPHPPPARPAAPRSATGPAPGGGSALRLPQTAPLGCTSLFYFFNNEGKKTLATLVTLLLGCRVHQWFCLFSPLPFLDSVLAPR